MAYKVARVHRTNPTRAEARGYPPIYVGVNREALVYGDYSYLPDATTAGVLSGIARADYNSPSVTDLWTLNAPGTTFRNLNFYGDVRPVGANMKFFNCKFFGGIGHPGNNRGCVTAYSNGDHNGLEFWDCTFEPRDPSWYRDGIVGNSYKAHRCIATGSTDGFGAFSATSGAGNCDVELWGCWVHNLKFWLQDPAHADGTHNDAVQYQGGSHLRVIGCRLDCYVTAAAGSTGNPAYPAGGGLYHGGSAIMMGQVTHQANDVLISGNTFSGGYAHINFNPGSTWTQNVQLGPNRYDRLGIRENYPPNPDKRWIAISNQARVNASGLYTDQRFSDDLSLLTAGRATGIRILS